ncbi:AaceriAAL016Cp [[Ashbya] aceris (nom. inval.)]|nr:AaceriAAL016Cp [[Ashbya] aceris (nom. inval.)]
MLTAKQDEIGRELRVAAGTSLIEYPVKEWLLARQPAEWETLLGDAAIFRGWDELLWGPFVACVYREPRTTRLNCLFVDRVGVMHLHSVDVSDTSRFYPAVENLRPEYRAQVVRRCLAVGLLKKYVLLDPTGVQLIRATLPYDYDQTTAGDLANTCELVEGRAARELGQLLVRLGLVQPRFVKSLMLDVVYENRPAVVDANNKLVYYLGEQLEQLFDPLTEYSPEPTELSYRVPDQPRTSLSDEMPLVVSICEELLQLQTNFTLSLVGFLQKFLIPLRIKALNEQVPGLSTVKLNNIFPPTIDEVTRVNCIFLDALKSALPFGAIEVLKACSITAPYFYKAYTRHEAATKFFSRDIKSFFSKFGKSLSDLDSYSEMKLDSLIHGPQEKLTKLKLIIDRLFDSKDWESNEEKKEAERCYRSICDVIDSFGRDEPLNAYNTRVFTPSGKILTELAKGWPAELQYKWLKRRVVGVFDVISVIDPENRDIVVIFSDYIVFLHVINGNLYYSGDSKKPLISDVLMNSLINEVPLPPKIPKLQVLSYSYIDDIVVSTYGKNSLRFDTLNAARPSSVAYTLASASVEASYVADLCTKAKILEKDTAFHLFKTAIDSFHVYSTAHESEAYKTERIKSPFVLFLNITDSVGVLQDHGATVGLFASLNKNDKVTLVRLGLDGSREESFASLDNFLSLIIEELLIFYPSYLSSAASPLFQQLMQINEQLVQTLLDPKGDHSGIKPKYALRASKKKKMTGNLVSTNDNPRTLSPGTTISKTPRTIATTTPKQDKRKSISQVGNSPGRASVSTSPRKQKRESILGKISGLFHKKDKKENKRHSVDSDTRSRRDNGSIHRLRHSASSFKELESPRQMKRFSSVVHTAVPSSSKRKTSGISPSKGTVNLRALQDGENNENTDVSKIPIPEGDSVFEDTIRVDGVDTDFYAQKDRLSKIYNDDLYGEVVLSSKNVNVVPTNVTGEQQKQRNTQQTIAKELLASVDQQQRQPARTAPAESQIVIPGLPESTVPQINFGRSPSFIELFGGMRLVLDENDESVNWRRLCSERSLNEKYQIRPATCAGYICGELAPPVGIVSDQRDMNFSGDNDAETPLPTHSSNKSILSDETLEKEEFERDFAISTPKSQTASNINTRRETWGYRHSHEEEDDSEQNANRKPTSAPAPSTIPGVVITANSPTKPWHKENARIKVSDVRSEGTDVSYISSLKKSSNRLVELSVNSQEDFEDERYYTPVIEPIQNAEVPAPVEQKEEALAVSNSSNEETLSKFLGSQGVIDLTEETIDYNATDRKHASIQTAYPVLDEVEFSTFHMSFGEMTAEGSNLSKQQESYLLSNSTTAGRQEDSHGPVFYKLPDFVADDSYLGYSTAERSKDERSRDTEDEAMWVSPSKLDIFDLSKQPESVYKGTSIPSKHAELLSKLRKDGSVKFEESMFIRDNSYVYLGQFLSADEAIEQDDKRSVGKDDDVDVARRL